MTQASVQTSPGIVGGAMLPHAPQFFTMPETEDRATVDKVRKVAAEIGARLRALNPDLWIIFSNDHAEQFFHNAAPPFTIHVGGAASGEFAGRKFHWTIPSEISFELVRQLYRQGFDPAYTSTAKFDYAMGIPLTHIGHTGPVLPIYVNAYLPPQPTMERCYAFGQAVARVVEGMGLRTVVLASGGMSHFPGTDRYSKPELAWDNQVLAKLATGNLKSLIGYDETELDETGNIELRCWACAAGALGERKPDVVSMDPSWHHNYASLGWFGGARPRHDAHYPSIKPELVELTAALHALAHQPEKRAAFVADPAAYADGFHLPPEQRAALIALDVPAIVAMGAHPLVPFLANMQIQRLRSAR
jgi:2,3-dihydroxyphenylpropionate 1,2-dioxygenase